ncbi:MAG TPA: response regulator, partial [Gemmataceae bacterium]|nr:response regulator [Gemmataceae bacterium]
MLHLPYLICYHLICLLWRVRMRILVVEDEPALRDVIARAFREEGYAVDEAGEGKDALFKATAWQYDAIVLDVMLPGMDG